MLDVLGIQVAHFIRTTLKRTCPYQTLWDEGELKYAQCFLK